MEQRDFYDVHDRHKARDLQVLKQFMGREDIAQYKIVLKEVLRLFGAAIKESLTRTMGEYLEATEGRLRNSAKTEWEKDVASRMICTNNPAEGPFATARAFLHMYPTLKLRTLATLCAAVVNGTYRPARKGTLNHTLTLNPTLSLSKTNPNPIHYRLLCVKVVGKNMLPVLD
jgi:hypothetical protein